jgi:dTDP-4-dehydrorhamnose reductase
MKILVTGSNGQLGTELVNRYSERPNCELFVGDLPDIDITSELSIASTFASISPDVVINCAAWTAVDAAEEKESSAFTVNAEGPAILATYCARAGARLVQISTDYVFEGDASEPYREDSQPGPITAYGRTKLAGENFVRELLPDNHIVIRTAWLYSPTGHNFVKTIVKAQRDRETLSVVTDQIGQPTSASDLADQIVTLLDTYSGSGIFHGTNSGVTSWFEFARAIMTEIGEDPERILPTDSSSYVQLAPRPAYSVLGHEGWASVGMAPMRDWRIALHEAMPEIMLAID